MTSIDRSRKLEFTGMGELYDRARPPYPPELFRQLDNHFNFRMGQTTLEIGCGTGKATEHLAARGLTVTGSRPQHRSLQFSGRQRISGFAGALGA